MTYQTVDKLDAACRQLNTAITLWFSDGDAVAIHTLTCSAYQIVHDINSRQCGRDLLYDSLIIKDEYRRDWINLLKKECNFFKHADNDPAGAIEFDPHITEQYMLFTLLGLELSGKPPDDIRGAFIIYYALCNPDRLTKKGKTRFIDAIPEENRKDALRRPKQQFFEAYTFLRKGWTSRP